MRKFWRASVGGCLVWALAGSGGAQEVVGKVIQIKPIKAADTANLQYRIGGSPSWYSAFLELPTHLHDGLKTDANTLAALEFMIGGRVGVNKDSEIEIVTERSVADAQVTLKRIILRKGGLWGKTSALRGHLEIQTNTLVMGIKGTEFVIDADPQGETSVAVLEGAVELTDNHGQVVGQAQPGDQYQVGASHPATHETYDPEILRSRLAQSPEWADMFKTLGELIRGIDEQKARLESLQNMQDLQDRLNGTYTERPQPPPKTTGGSTYASSVATVDVLTRVPGAGEAPRPRSPSEQGSATPVFQWDGLQGADGYVLMVSRDESFAQLEWSARVREGQVAYPSTARPLEKGPHFWRVYAVDRDDQPLPDKKGAQMDFKVP